MKKIEKPWGHELIYAQSDKYVGKILHIEKGEQLSLQYHSVKDESIYLLSGVMDLTIEEDGQLKRLRVTPGECYRIPPKMRHRFSAVEQCDVLEVSTPELHDVVRLEDKYGRINRNNYGVIMAGGHGTRFWPRSRRKTPKQLLDIISSEPMIRETFKRINKTVSANNIYVIANQEHRAELEKNIPEIPQENLIFEPMARNTASCIGLAAQLIYEKNHDGVMSVFPADHLITDDEAFTSLLTVGFELASQKDYLLTLGMKPGYPETGYGYIKSGDLFQSFNGFDFFLVDHFVEKPDRETAERFIGSGQYSWNGGIFIWKARVILDSIKLFLPDLYRELSTIPAKMKRGKSIEEILEKIYPGLDPISIDYGVLEHARNVLVVPCSVGWSDLGGWAALDTLVERKSESGNVTWSKHINIDTKDCIIYSPKKLVATIGLENIIIVETDDALLVSTKERSQEVKQIVEKLKESGLEDYL